MDRRSNLGSEDQAVLSPVFPGFFPILVLEVIVAMQNLDGAIAECNYPPALFRFGLGELHVFLPDELAFNLDGLLGPIQVAPFQAQDYHLPHSGLDCQVQKRFHTTASRRHEQLAEPLTLNQPGFQACGFARCCGR